MKLPPLPNMATSGQWCTGDVTNMVEAFAAQTTFNEDISGWDVSIVTDLGHMFYSAANFNQDLSG